MVFGYQYFHKYLSYFSIFQKKFYDDYNVLSLNFNVFYLIFSMDELVN